MIFDQKLRQLVDRYIQQYRPYLARELAYFSENRGFSVAIKKAALSTCRCGRVLSHQRRNGRKALSAAEKELQRVKEEIRKATSFKGLHQIVKSATSDVDGFGELATYDVALRIGAYRGFFPEEVYLHAGARRGAEGERIQGTRIPQSCFRQPIRALRPYEIENFLCIFEDQLCGRVVKKGRPLNRKCDICGIRERA